MSHFADFCDTRRFSNFGLPSQFHADIMALPGATLGILPSILGEILSHSPDILIFYFGSFDLLAFQVSVLSVAWAFCSFIQYISFLLAAPSGHCPVIFIIKQHFWLRAPGSRVSSFIYFQHFLRWNTL